MRFRVNEGQERHWMQRPTSPIRTRVPHTFGVLQYAKELAINWLNPHGEVRGRNYDYLHSFLWGKWGPEGRQNLPEVTQAVNHRVGVGAQTNQSRCYCLNHWAELPSACLCYALVTAFPCDQEPEGFSLLQTQTLLTSLSPLLRNIRAVHFKFSFNNSPESLKTYWDILQGTV